MAYERGDREVMEAEKVQTLALTSLKYGSTPVNLGFCMQQLSRRDTYIVTS